MAIGEYFEDVEEKKPEIKTEGNISVIKEKSKTISCDQCSKKFSDRRCLKRHIQSVHENIKYTCNQCELQVSSKGSLTRHVDSV